MILEETLEKIKKPSQEAMERCRQHWDSIAKPLHSLGKLEDALVRIAGMTGNERIHLDKKALVVMCADNGVVEELSLIHISEPTRRTPISYAVFCLKKKKKK